MIRYTTFRQTKIRYSDTGKGRALVLLHGFPESLVIWENFALELSKHFRVIAIDLPGFGETPCIGYDHSMDLFAECVKAVMDDMGYRKYVVCGHSMGGYVALAFAELFPENTAGSCLFHSSALPDSDEKKQDRIRAAEIVKKDQKHFVSELINKLFAPDNMQAFEKEIMALKDIGYNTPAQGVISALLGMKDRPDRRTVLQKTKVPVLFIVGKEDRVMPAASLIEQSQIPKKGNLLLLEKSGHMGFYEEKEKALKGLLKFTRKCFRESD